MAQGTERECITCGKTFTGDQRRCWSCRPPSRCAECGREFRGRGRKCTTCSSTERQCITCGKTFRGRSRSCYACRNAVERVCADCGASYCGIHRKCPTCFRGERECVHCGRVFRNYGKPRCPRCVRVERRCEDCGKAITDTNRRCQACRATERECSLCGATFRGNGRKCRPCGGYGDHLCRICGNTFRGHERECATCSGKSVAGANARRARKRAVSVAGPVSAAVYRKIRQSGPCVYCGATATTVDHVRPLARGGHEAEYNLVPACEKCNKQKHVRLLTEWDPVKVARAVTFSPLVAEEMDRLLASGV